jgi:sugar lactone lactonase YvrE
MITPSGQVTTLAGWAGISGTNDGIGSAARFDYPEGVAVDSAGNVYVADTGNSAIRQLTLVGTNWTVTTLAGVGGTPGASNGIGSSARFSSPYGIAVNHSGTVYIADSGNDAIRTLIPAGANSMVSTLAGLLGTSGTNDGTGNGARFNYPEGISVDSTGNLYVSDTSNVRIRKVTPSGVVSTLAGSTAGYGSGDGTGSAAQFEYPVGITVDKSGNVYIADPENYNVRKGILATLVPLPTLQSPTLSTGQFGCEVTGSPGLTIEIQSSIDFINWQLVGTYTLEGGSNHFVNPYPSVVAQFYRGHVR